MDRTVKPVTPAVAVRSEAAIVHAYLCAKLEILKSPYRRELLDAATSPDEVSESQFGVVPGSVVLINGVNLTVDSSDDTHWTRGWVGQYQQLLPGSQRQNLNYQVK